MPVPRKAGIGRRPSWNDRHLAHLLTGIDWGTFMGDDGWGNLDGTDDEIRATVADMAECWRLNRELVTPAHVGLNDHGEPPWFSQFADDPERLVAEAIADREYTAEQHRRGRWFPREEFEATYNPATVAPAAAVNE